MNAVSLIATHTSRKDTSLVRVYPCRTLGSARRVVEGDTHGVGKSKDPSTVALDAEDGANVSLS